jgi:hypothetical protein
MKILNLFSGIGGNRMLWKDHNVTAVEIHKGVAKYYKEEFPDDEVIIADAYTFLEDNYTEFDFIWASSPCKTHSLLQCMRSKRKYNKVYDYDKITKHSFGSRKDTILHNCMKPELGKYILEQIIKENEIRGLTL